MADLKFSDFRKDIGAIEAVAKNTKKRQTKALQRIGKSVGLAKSEALKARKQRLLRKKIIEDRKREHLLWWE